MTYDEQASFFAQCGWEEQGIALWYHEKFDIYFDGNSGHIVCFPLNAASLEAAIEIGVVTDTPESLANFVNKRIQESLDRLSAVN